LDTALSRANVAVLVHGEFWHGWRLPTWEHKLSPFWRNKLRANRARDQRNFRRLRSRGWTVVRIWQHEIANNLERCVQRILMALEPRCPASVETRIRALLE
jgi:DNA mismatch endonuclease (patch repair protein)